MRSFSVALRVAGLAALALALIGCDRANEVDTILRGAIVYDGSGSAGRRADVAIDDGEIVAIGSVANLSGRQELDLDGRAVAPGFVDIHSHADLILLADEPDRSRLLEAKTRQPTLADELEDFVVSELLTSFERHFWTTMLRR